MNCVEVKDGTMLLRSNDGVMWFGINEERAKWIVDAMRIAKEKGDPKISYYMNEQVNSLLRSKDVKDKIEALKLAGYTEIGDFDSMVLFVKCSSPKDNIYMFRYVSKRWPDKNGTNPIAMVMNI